MANISIDVRKKTIQEFINDEVPSGRYWLPSFQRQYVWDPDNIKELLDSIVRNYPIGATILWKPSSEIASDIDPTSIPIIDDATKNIKDRFFIIDGQQRLTSILLLFRGWAIKRGGEDITCDRIAYDPVVDKFIKSRNRGIDFSEIVRAFCLHDMDILNKLRNETQPIVFEQIKKLSQKILEYPIPQYIMETTGELEMSDGENSIYARMAQAFVRINKEGMRIGNVELMLSFMAGTLSGDLKNRVTKLYNEYERTFALAIPPIIRFVFSNLGLSQTQLAKPKQFAANIEKIREIPADDTFQRLVDSEKALKFAINFIKEEFGLQSSRLIPSQTTIIPLATYFYKHKFDSIDDIDKKIRQDIASWFVLCNLNGHYSASVDTRLNRDIELIKESDIFPFAELRNRMKVRKFIAREYMEDGLDLSALREANKAHVFLLYILLAKADADDWGGLRIVARRLEELERHHIFPREYLTQTLELEDEDDPTKTEVVLSNLGNITFILGEVNASIGAAAPADYLARYSERLNSHYIPNDPRLWTKEAYDSGEFQQERINLLFNAAKKFFPAVFRNE